MRKPLLALALVVLSATVLAQAPAPKPLKLAAADLQKLKWIEGSWKGTGGNVPAFYERYRIEGTTLIVEGLEETRKVKDTSRFELVNGELRSGTAANGSVAIILDDKGITFEFTQTNRGSFRWQRESADVWKAILKWPASGNRTAGELIYRMERLK